MAGFDAMFRFHADDRDLMVALMAAARRRARALGVRWHSSVSVDGQGYCRMDGNGFWLDMLLERMRRAGSRQSRDSSHPSEGPTSWSDATPPRRSWAGARFQW